MAPWLYFILGAAMSGVVFGLIAWCEELKCKRIEIIYNNSIQKQKAIYDKAIKELDEFYPSTKEDRRLQPEDEFCLFQKF